jgi:hypothetical protein
VITLSNNFLSARIRGRSVRIPLFKATVTPLPLSNTTSNR